MDGIPGPFHRHHGGVGSLTTLYMGKFSSLASLTKRHYLWYIALVCTIVWLFFLDAWFLFY